MDFCFNHDKVAQSLSRLCLDNSKHQGGFYYWMVLSRCAIFKCPVGRPRHVQSRGAVCYFLNVSDVRSKLDQAFHKSPNFTTSPCFCQNLFCLWTEAQGAATPLQVTAGNCSINKKQIMGISWDGMRRGRMQNRLCLGACSCALLAAVF